MRPINIKVQKEFAYRLLSKLTELIKMGNEGKKMEDLERSAKVTRDEVLEVFGIQKPKSLIEREKAEEEEYKDDCDTLDVLTILHKALWDSVRTENPDTCHNIVPGCPDLANVNGGVLYIKFEHVKPLLHQIAIGDYQTRDGMHDMKMNIAYAKLVDLVKHFWIAPAPPKADFGTFPKMGGFAEYDEQAIRAGKTNRQHKLELQSLSNQLRLEKEARKQEQQEYSKWMANSSEREAAAKTSIEKLSKELYDLRKAYDAVIAPGSSEEALMRSNSEIRRAAESLLLQVNGMNQTPEYRALYDALFNR